MTLAIWLLGACGGGSEGEGQGSSQTEQTVDEPAPYIYEDLDDEETPYDQAELEATLNLALAQALEWHAQPALDAYAEAMKGASDDCPDYYSDGSNIYWYDYCTSESGSTFNGYAYSYVYEDYSDGTYVYNGDQIYAQAVIETEDGYDFEAGGYAYDMILDDDVNGAIIHYSALGGAFAWNGGGVEDTWMGEGVRAETAMWISHYPEYNANYVYLNGGVTNLSSVYETVSFTEISYGNQAGWWPCDGEVAGTMSARAEDGSWFDVVFDVDGATWEVDEALCDGCGTVWHRGEIVGEACPDPTPLIDWESAPW